MEGNEGALAGLRRTAHVCGGAVGDDDQHTVDERVSSSRMGATKHVWVLARLVVILIREVDWHTVDELVLEITHCSGCNGLRELFVAAALGRVITSSKVWLSIRRLTDHLSGHCVWGASHQGLQGYSPCHSLLRKMGREWQWGTY
jgi:hypothetical protein